MTYRRNHNIGWYWMPDGYWRQYTEGGWHRHGNRYHTYGRGAPRALYFWHNNRWWYRMLQGYWIHYGYGDLHRGRSQVSALSKKGPSTISAYPHGSALVLLGGSYLSVDKIYLCNFRLLTIGLWVA